MLRYVHIGDQINDDENEFAIYDTITDRFVSFYGMQAFTSMQDLRESWERTPQDKRPDWARLESLCGHHGTEAPPETREMAFDVKDVLEDTYSPAVPMCIVYGTLTHLPTGLREEWAVGPDVPGKSIHKERGAAVERLRARVEALAAPPETREGE